MQLDMFSGTVPAAVELRATTLPTPADMAAHLGTSYRWERLRLGQVLALWESAYVEFIAALEGPLDHARSFCKPNGKNYGTGGPLARAFYQRESQRLAAGLQQLRAAADQIFCDNLTVFLDKAKKLLRSAGVEEAEIEVSEDWFNQVFQRPTPADLKKPLPQLMADLASEYTRLLEHE